MTKTLAKHWVERNIATDFSKKRARSKETNEILGLLKLGKSGTEIAKTLGL
jgi:DNA-binding NarL/FixJ family response regulator